MDKYEYQAKLEEINKLVDKEEYEGAAAIADTIEWKRVRSVRTLCMVSEVYEAIGRAEDSKAILYRAYRRSPNSRQILYRLTEACVQTQDFDDAVEYYTEYVNLSPNDNSKYVLKYEIYKGRGSSIEEQIGVLEEFRSREYTEQWAYELAKLYDQAGMSEKCVAECDDLALWFHNGKYVVQALELKKKYVPLTPEQQTIYDNPSEIVDMETKEAVVEKAVPTLGEAITNDLPKSERDVIADSILMDTEKQIAAAVQAVPIEKEPEPIPEPVKDLNTVDLQSELANSMRQILSGLKTVPDVAELESAPVMQQATEKNRVPEPEVEEEIPQQMSIDDLLTGTTMEETKPETVPTINAEPVMSQKEASMQDDLLSAPTIDISQKIKQEIGDISIREYAAAAAKKVKVPQEEIPKQPVMEKMPQMEIPKQPIEEVPQEEVLKQPTEEKVPQTAAQPAMEKTRRPVINPNDYTREALDEKEKEMLGFWAKIRGMNEQINLAVTQIVRSSLADKTSSRGNVLLVGDAGNGRTTLAISIAKIVSRSEGKPTAKVAKIYAEDLNNKDIAATVNKMAGGVLIIEEAGDLNDNAVGQLSMAMDFKTDSLVVMLEDERRYLQDLLARNPQFAQKFDITINVPMLTNDELVEFGKYYAIEKECVLDETAAQALYDSIGMMQSPEQPVAILDVKEIVDKAIRHANRFGLGKMISSLSGKRYDEHDRVILQGKNFKKIK
ncbi:MAG: hypothetical protein ACOX8M_11630 [Marvinbryantia sp.]